MLGNDVQRIDLLRIASNPVSLEIDFSTIPELTFQAKEILECTLLGAIGRQHNFNRCNLVSTKMLEVAAFDANFDNVDFKDCRISDSSFRSTRFSVGAMAGCIVAGTTFSECLFPDVSITETEFRRARFEDCDLSKMLIKNCTFVDCSFRNCVTSNKLFEASLLVNCTFEQTELEFRTISGNFGITAEQLVSSRVRGLDVVANSEEAANLIRNSTFSAVERFRIRYFLSPMDALASDELEKLLEAASWREYTVTPSHFVSIFGTFVDFLTRLFDRDTLPAFVIWRLHSTTAILAEEVSNSNADLARWLFKPLSGIQADLARLVGKHIELYDALVGVQGLEVTLLVEGPLDKSYFERELAHWFGDSGVTITRLIPHNSPSEMTLLAAQAQGLAPFLALLICTRMSFQLQQLDEMVKLEMGTRNAKSRRTTGKPSARAAVVGIMSPFALSIGLTENHKAYELKLMTLLPGRHLLNFMVQVRLDVPVKTIARAKELIIGLWHGE